MKVLEGAVLGVFAALGVMVMALKALGGFLGDSIELASKHQLVLSHLDSVIKATSTSVDKATKSGGYWATSQDLSSKATKKLNSAIEHQQNAMHDLDIKNQIAGKQSKSSAAAAAFHAVKISELNAQLEKGTEIHKTWVSGVKKAAEVSLMSRDALLALADAQSKSTRFSRDENIEAEATMLTFTKINKDVYPRAMKLTADYAEIMGVTLPEAAKIMGRSLGDPVSGIGRMNSQLKLFTPEELKAVEAMAKHKSVAEAQGVVMDALSKKFAGAAEAAGNTYSGAMAILTHRIQDFQRSIGDALLPALVKMAQKLGPILDALLPKLVKFLSEKVTPFLMKAADAFGHFIDTIGEADNPLTRFINFIQGLSSGILNGIQNVQRFARHVEGMADRLGAAWNKGVTDVTRFLRHLQGMSDRIPVAISNAIKDAGAAIGKFGSEFRAKGTVLVISLIGGIRSKITSLQTAVSGGITDAVNGLGTAISNFRAKGTVIISTLVAGITQKAKDVAEGVGKALTEAVNGAADSMKDFLAKGREIIANIVQGVFGKNLDISVEVNKAIQKGVDDIGTTIDSFLDIGKNIIDAIVKGIKAAPGAILEALKGIIQEAIANVKASLGIQSPSKVFAAIGLSIPQGMAQGIHVGKHLPSMALAGLAPKMIGTAVSYQSSQSNSGNTVNNNQYFFGNNVHGSSNSQGAALVQAFRKS